MKILDSNIWIAFFDKDDSCHEKARGLFKSYIDENITITDHIILEVITLLIRKSGKMQCNTFIDFIQNNTQINIFYTNKIFFDTYLTFIKNSESEKLAFVDQALLYLSKEFEIITFDKELLKAIGTLGNS